MELPRGCATAASSQAGAVNRAAASNRYRGCREMRGPCKVSHNNQALGTGPGTYVKDKFSWRALNLSAAGATNCEGLYRCRPAKAGESGDIMSQDSPIAGACR